LKLELSSRVAGIRGKLGQELLRVHRNYQPLLAKMPRGMIKGIAHVTGGGLIDNLPRTMPKTCHAVVETNSWQVPRIFRFLEQNGKVGREEMYQVFNMGIGMAVIVSKQHAKRAAARMRAKLIGEIEPGAGKTRLIF
jgi:phosphoribosylformylglycinamidine cyclo-ligase